MKKIAKLFSALALAGLFSMSSCSNDDNDNGMEMTSTTIVDLALATDDLSILVDALTRANLVTTLQGDGPFTVFAPTNDAFTAFLAANNFSSLDDVPVSTLTDILLNHVVSGTNTSSSLSTGYVSSLSTAGADGRSLSLLWILLPGLRSMESLLSLLRM